MGDRRQIDVADSVAVLLGQRRGDLHGQACLARSAGSGEGDQPVVGQRFA